MRHPFLSAVLSLVMGITMVGSFAPYHHGFFAPVIVIGLYALWQSMTPKQAWRSGYLFGCGLFGFGTWWVTLSIHNYGFVSLPLAACFTLLFIAWLALFPAFTAWSLQKLAPESSWFKAGLLFPALWTLFEWLRGWVITGYPWMALGYSQLGKPLSGFAPIFSVYGVSFALVSVSGLLALGLLRNQLRDKALAASLITVIILSGYGLARIQWTHPVNSTPLTVATLQMNVPQEEKWLASSRAAIYQRYHSATLKLFSNDLVIWPEAAIPGTLQDLPVTTRNKLRKLSRQARRTGTSLLIGVPVSVDDHYYNALIARGVGKGQYFKQHLVPFGEYWPLQSWLGPAARLFDLPMSMLSPGSRHQPPITHHNTTISTTICYEITYPDLVRKSLKNHHVMVTITDDSWFGTSIASDQHLEIAQMRSLENGRYQVFSSNSGVSAVITPDGSMSSQTLPYEPAVLEDSVLAMTGKTPWQRFGLIPLALMIIVIIGQACRLRLRPYRFLTQPNNTQPNNQIDA